VNPLPGPSLRHLDGLLLQAMTIGETNLSVENEAVSRATATG
jgi:hypothetical protein